MRGLKGKRVLITGGVSGIGLATIKRFLDEGAEVVILDQDKDGADRANREFQNLSGYLLTDVADHEAVNKAFMALDEIFQGLS